MRVHQHLLFMEIAKFFVTYKGANEEICKLNGGRNYKHGIEAAVKDGTYVDGDYFIPTLPMVTGKNAQNETVSPTNIVDSVNKKDTSFQPLLNNSIGEYGRSCWTSTIGEGYGGEEGPCSVDIRTGDVFVHTVPQRNKIIPFHALTSLT